MKLLHVLDHSLPHTDGYAVRAASILRFQTELGWQPMAVTSPFHPGTVDNGRETIAGVDYVRTQACKTSLPLLREATSINVLRESVIRHVQSEKPDVIHAHSSCLWGLAAMKAARRHKLPFVYEIRSFWEDGAVDQGKTSYGSLRYRATRRLETHVVRHAHAVVTIAELMKDELVGRGIDPQKIFVVPNGLDASRFQESEPDAELVEQLGLKDSVTLGYVGSLYAWEGVDELLRAMPRIAAELHRRGRTVKLLVVGGGEEEESLRRLVDQLELKDCVHMAGRVPNESIERYYSLLDVLVYPRRKTRLTDLVTPLKPLEAMAMGKAVVASDVGGLRELIGDGNGVFYRPGNVHDLAAQCVEIVEDTNKRKSMASKACEYARVDRDWRQLVPLYRDAYRFAMRQAGVQETSSVEPQIDSFRPSQTRSSVGA